MSSSSLKESTKQKYAAGELLEEVDAGPPPPVVSEFSQTWTNTINSIRSPILSMILLLSKAAAAAPWLVVIGTILLSLSLVIAGLLTNFSVDVDEDTLWSPETSLPKTHLHYIDVESGFRPDPRTFLLNIHANGQNVLSQDGVARVFAAVDAIRSADGFTELCANTGHFDFNGIETCPLSSVTNFWNDTLDLFESSVANDEETIIALSSSKLPNGADINPSQVMGKPMFGSNSELLESATSFVVFLDLPAVDNEATAEVELNAIDALMELRKAWAAEDTTTTNPGNYVLELFGDRSFSDEFTRAIVTDIPLVPIVFTIMSIFTCVVFSRNDWVLSRSMLGFGAVTTVLLAIMTGYGILFMIGTPFTSMTQILPFIMFGIGLDNAFIISGEYNRTDPRKTAPERIHDTITEVGLSIFLTTITSVVAFALGLLSSIPAVIWLCEYAAPTILINFIYQLTFFVALIVIDERRIQENRRDWFICSTVQGRDTTTEQQQVAAEATESWFDRFMGWYADVLTNPIVGGLVVVLFGALLGACTFSASLLEQDFQFTDVVPKDSYVADFWNSFTAYNDRSGVRPAIYFRYQDQCDADIQEQMIDYVNQLVDLDEVTNPPFHFWLADFQQFVASSNDVQGQSCEEQVASFLQVPQYRDLYESELVLNETDGRILVSRTRVEFSNVNQESVTEQVDALLNQRRVTRAQPVNANTNDFSFFTFDGLYFIWEFYSTAPQELTQTTIAGVVAVSILGLLFIPHWTAVLFVAPMISILYVDLLGVLQFAGLHVNAVSYISLVMSIGLLVDFLMHVLLRYYESEYTDRKSKVKDTLKTMGASILVGAISTFLGVIPLAFSTSEIFTTIFVTFVGLVTLGAGHGLILLPVLLSFFGPTVCIKPNMGDSSSDKNSTTQDGSNNSKSLEPVFVNDIVEVDEGSDSSMEEFDA